MGELQDCPICKGGTLPVFDALTQTPISCPICHGTGKTFKKFKEESDIIIFEGLNLNNPNPNELLEDGLEDWQQDQNWWKAE